MRYEFLVIESEVTAAWLYTLYDLIDELNCTYETEVEDFYSKTYKIFKRVRSIIVFGSPTMIGFLRLRMSRYEQYIEKLNNSPVFMW